jgi:hypothetical protein
MPSFFVPSFPTNVFSLPSLLPLLLVLFRFCSAAPALPRPTDSLSLFEMTQLGQKLRQKRLNKRGRRKKGRMRSALALSRSVPSCHGRTGPTGRQSETKIGRHETIAFQATKNHVGKRLKRVCLKPICVNVTVHCNRYFLSLKKLTCANDQFTNTLAIFYIRLSRHKCTRSR